MYSTEINAAELRSIIDGGDEVAVLDVREEADFARDGHLFLAVSTPLSRISCSIQRLVPRRTTQIVLCDAGEELSNAAAIRLKALGYHNIKLFREPQALWGHANFEIFYGINVPSKTFGEFIQKRDRAPNISPKRLVKLRDEENAVILDCRPPDEYVKGTIPGAINCPGSELVHRVGSIVPDGHTPIIVNCAGRTRSIIGAQSLIAAGIRNPVKALEGGVMAWRLAGFEPERGACREFSEYAPSDIESNRMRARQLAESVGVSTLSNAEFSTINGNLITNLHLFDIRPSEEFRAGHLQNARNVLGVQLVQKTDSYVGTIKGTIAVTDDTGVRAWMTAYWLAQMGLWKVLVVDGTTCQKDWVQHSSPLIYEVPRQSPASRASFAITPVALAKLIADSSVTVIDLALSNAYKNGHIPSAKYASPLTIHRHIGQPGSVVLTSSHGCLAETVARESDLPLRWLEGGTAAWIEQGFPLEHTTECYLDEPNDVFIKPYELASGQSEAMKEYLKWEIGLLEALKRDKSVSFRSTE